MRKGTRMIGLLFLLWFCCAATIAEHLGPPTTAPDATTTTPTTPPATTTTETDGAAGAKPNNQPTSQTSPIRPSSSPTNTKTTNRATLEQANSDETTSSESTTDDTLESPDPEYEIELDTDSIKIISTSLPLHEQLALLYQHMNPNVVNAADQDVEQLLSGNSIDQMPNFLFGIESEYAKAAEAERQAMSAEEQEQEQQFERAMKSLHKGRSEFNAVYATLTELMRNGHKRATAELAWLKLLTQSSASEVDAVRELWQMLVAKDGRATAHTGLGYMYATGIGMNVSQARAIVHYTLGALGDDPIAQMALGYRYWSGATVPTNCERALSYYRRVAVKVAATVTFSGGTAVHRVRLLDEVENTGSGAGNGYFDNDLIEYYQMMAEKGDINSQVGLGQLHYQGGRGLPQDMAKALQYFMPAANAGSAIAMAFLGKIYLEGNDVVKASNETALGYFTKAAELGNAVGQSGLGIMYLQGKGVARDTAKAFSYFTQAAEQGWVDGQLQLGNMYFAGVGVKRDFKLANKYYSLASQSGHVLAYYNLAQMNALGLGVLRSCPTAVELFKNVAERGRWSEHLMRAHVDYKAYRFDVAFKKYALAGEMGYEVGQSNAAFLLDRSETALFGDRNEQLVRALQLWCRAAAQGYSAAQVKLGDYHYYGLGTPVDYDAAASHYRMASEQQHNAQAMFNLGYMHEQGLGMQRDWHLAKRSYDSAAATSVDAKIPVALALLKLSVMFNLEMVKESPLQIVMDLADNITSNWDLYLITALTMMLGLLIYLRPPAEQQAAGAPAPAAAAEPQPAAPAPADAVPAPAPAAPVVGAAAQQPDAAEMPLLADVQ